MNSIKPQKDGLLVSYSENEELFDNVLISIGRVPNSENLKLENTKIKTSEQGYIQVNDRMETSIPGIFAI